MRTLKKAKPLITAAEHSIGSKEAPEAARMELKNLLNDMDIYASRLEELLQSMEKRQKEIPDTEKYPSPWLIHLSVSNKNSLICKEKTLD